METRYNWEYERRVRACFIGCGGHAVRNIYPTFQYAPIDLVAVCDLDEAKAKWCARQFGAQTTYVDYRAMLERERPEVVFIVTNYDAQGRPRYPLIASDVMEAGAHAWIEKPPASSAEEILRLIETSRRTNRHIVVGFKKMFNTANQKAKTIIESPSFGKVAAITARYPQFLPPVSERRDPHAMLGFLDHMVHPHSVLYLLGGPLTSICVARANSGAAVVQLRFANGATGSLLLSSGQSGTGPFERTEVIGEGENVVVENNLRVIYYRRGGTRGRYGYAATYYDTEGEPAALWEPEFSLGQPYSNALFLQGYVAEINEICACALENRPPRFGGLDAALEMMRVYEAYLCADDQIAVVASK